MIDPCRMDGLLMFAEVLCRCFVCAWNDDEWQQRLPEVSHAWFTGASWFMGSWVCQVLQMVISLCLWWHT